MSGLYIHIPYCKKLCYYCDFHFSLNIKTRTEFVNALCRELELQKNLVPQPIETIYFGGGTPSVLTENEISQIFQAIQKNYNIVPNAEISFECNPDDLSEDYCKMLIDFGINRLSIGIQSFFDDDLIQLNRRHSSVAAKQSVTAAQKTGFENITIDLIYGLPQMTLERWKQNLAEVVKLNVQHLSAYSLMVEEHTALHKFVKTGKFILPKEESVIEQFNYLIDWSIDNNFEQYEISNFAKNGMYSRHNSSYWAGIPYIGVGPSANSFDGIHRYWNIAHNAKYIASINDGIIPYNKETLSQKDMFNELIMTGLRTKKGVDITLIKKKFPNEYYRTFISQKNSFIAQNLLQENEHNISLTRKGIMISDMIMSDLFRTE